MQDIKFVAIQVKSLNSFINYSRVWNRFLCLWLISGIGKEMMLKYRKCLLCLILKEERYRKIKFH